MTVRLLLFVLLFGFHVLHAQEEMANDTLRSIPADTLRLDRGNKVITIDTYASRFNPRKALLYSAIIPGTGQIYNRKYWKVPIVMAGFGTGIYLIAFHQDNYKTYKGELFGILTDGSTTSPSGFNETQLRRLVDRSKRERDFFTIVTGFWYILQLVDAHVDAHLKEFDLNPQLQVRLEPMMENNPVQGRSTGLSLKFKF